MASPYLSGFAALVLLAVGALTLLIGIVLVRRGWWPRRVGTDPHCRRCGYLLVGITSERCPECGTTISPRSTIHGERHRRAGVAWLGVAIIVLGIVFAMPFVALKARGTDWYQFRPTLLVMRDFRIGSNALQSKALVELLRREKIGQLSSQTAADLFAEALAEQMRPQLRPFGADLIDFAGRQALGNNEKITQKQREQFYQQGAWTTLTIGPIVLSVEPIPYVFRAFGRSPRGTTAGFRGPIATIDGRLISPGRVNNFAVAGGGGSVNAIGSVPRQPEGTHVISLTWQLKVQDGLPRPGDPPGKVSYQDDPVYSSTIHVHDGPFPSTKAIDDPKVSPELLRQSLNPMNFQCIESEGRRSMAGSIRINNPPAGIAFDVFIRYENREYLAGAFYAPAGIVGTVYFTNGPTFIPAPPGKLDVILRANHMVALGARNTLGFVSDQTWQGELIYADVPVLMGQSPAATQPASRPVDASAISTPPQR
jgi:hypothetical protein